MSTKLRLITTAALAAALVSGCDGSIRREGPPELPPQVIRTDPERNRLWVLEAEALTLYDNTNARRLRRVVLPDWVMAGAEHGCAPGLALDAAGTVFVSSNVLPVLWRVEPSSFEVQRIELALDADADKDVGFTGLSFAGDGTLMAAGATFASLWRIDIAAARASKVAAYPLSSRACDPATLLLAAANTR